jgi:signal transduction histidine kinase
VEVGYLPIVRADPAHLRQVFQNLVSNALKYRRDVPLELRISSRQEDGNWWFTVSDNGIGFKQEYGEKIFGMFQRLVSRRQYEGTGMGLAIVAKVVENHGGRITVRSEPGVGSTFEFCLPNAAQPVLSAVG